MENQIFDWSFKGQGTFEEFKKAVKLLAGQLDKQTLEELTAPCGTEWNEFMLFNDPVKDKVL